MTHDDGGPAFPHQEHSVETGRPLCASDRGISLWDYMAGQALAGLLASGEHTDCTPAEYAHDAYNYADAMIAEKRRREGGAH